MFTHTAYKGRIVPVLTDHLQSTCTIISGLSYLLKPVLGISLPVIAALICGCQKQSEEEYIRNELREKDMVALHLEWDDGQLAGQVGKVSVFVFNSDSLGRLDAYQEFDRIDGDEVRIASTSGMKRIFICANLTMSKEEIMRISTAEDLEECFFMLEDTRRAYPLMLGSTETDTGHDSRPVVRMRTMTSEIVLNSVSCCFDGTAYEGERITEAKVYLINVNAQCCLSESMKDIRRLVNIGMLNPADVSNFTQPDIICQELDEDIGENPVKGKITLLCFHNFCKEETPGSPFTRLVLEGKIQGETYYWPLTVNRTQGGEGVRNNSRHIFDLKIRRKGSLDPDTELTIEECGIFMEMKEWKETDIGTIRF